MATVIHSAARNPQYYQQIQEIFWETSARSDFADLAEKKDFENRYLGIYLESYAEFVFVACEGQRVVGYILGAPDTLKAEAILKANLHMAIFEDMYQRYPAHLHINLRAETRGQGIGSELIKAFEDYLIKKSVTGLHLITSSTARNVSFYLKNGFVHKVERLWNGRPLLLLGKTLQV